MAHRSPSSRPYRAPSIALPITIAIVAGAAAGVASVLALVAARVSLVAGDQVGVADHIALFTPMSCALGAGILAVFLLHLCKVSERGVLITVAISAAAPAFALGHLARLFDPALALAAGGAGDRLSVAFWLDGCAWLESARAADIVFGAPGLRPVSGLVGIEACATLAMVELALVAGLLLAAIDQALDAPLCFGCRLWCRRQSGAIRRAADGLPPTAVIERAGVRDWRFLRELGAPRGGASLDVHLATCPSCDRTSEVSISLSRPLRRDLTLVRDLKISRDDLRTLRALAAAPPPPHLSGASTMQAASPATRAQIVAG